MRIHSDNAQEKGQNLDILYFTNVKYNYLS
jgi:hypothetical protein